MLKNNPRTVNAWCFYDWANSVHSLVIISGIFPIYFLDTTAANKGMIPFFGGEIKNSVLFSYSVSAAFLVIACISPICSAIADSSGRKKAFLQFFCYLGSASCAMLYFFTDETIPSSTIYFILSLIGWAGSVVFYNSFLPEITTPDRYDTISARGYALGYAGSVLLMLFNLSMILQPDWYGGISGATAAKISFLTVGLWWAGFAQVTFRQLPNRSERITEAGNWLVRGFIELKKVWKQLGGLPIMKRFLLSFFFYSMGVQTVMYLAEVFGKDEIKLKAPQLIITILLIQLVAITGALFFSWLSGKIKNLYTLIIVLGIWVAVCFAGYFIHTATEFYVLATVVGFVMGGVQALSRSTFAKMLPPDTQETASFFSFYDVTEKVAIVLGTAGFGYIQQLSGSMRNSILFLSVMFLLGMATLVWTKFSSKNQSI